MENKTLPVKIEFVPKTYDIDFAGVVSNIVYVRWLEDLRYLWLEKYFPLQNQMEKGFAPAVASTDIKYKIPIKMFSKVKGVMWVQSISRIKYTLCAEIYSDDKIAATAVQIGCFVGLEDLKPIRIPPELMDLYMEFSI